MWQLQKRVFQIIPGDVYGIERENSLLHKCNETTRRKKKIVRIKSCKVLEITLRLVAIWKVLFKRCSAR